MKVGKKSIEMRWSEYSMPYFSADYTSDQTALTIISGRTGYTLVVRSIYISCSSNTGNVYLYFEDGSSPVSTKKMIRLFLTRSQQIDWEHFVAEGYLGQGLKLTTTQGASGSPAVNTNLFISLNYTYEPDSASSV